MASIRWLHLTDLHVGMGAMPPLWAAVESIFYESLETVLHSLGGIDVVLFSGDLVQSGTAEEFQKLDNFLDRLWTRFRKLGCDPVLLAIPGNHDLARPKESDPRTRALLNWTHDEQLRGKLFWDEIEGKEYRGLVDAAFIEYTQWAKRWAAAHPLPEGIRITSGGLLPGDFSATIRKDGFTLGIVGLNSGFLQLDGHVGPGKIALHPSQLLRVCGGDPNSWAAAHHVCLLMTHHPPSWLTPDALAYYQGHMFLPQWFAGHFHGHMHEPRMVVQSIGGAPPDRLFQGASLFGLEEWDDTAGRHQSRIHGYSAGRLELGGNNHVTLRLWPRIAQRDTGTGRWRIKPDYDNYDLKESEENSITVNLGARKSPSAARELATAPAAEPTLADNSKRSPQPPGLGYDPAWYVPRAHQEQRVLDMLREPGAPVIIAAAPMSGKSTMLRRLMDRFGETDPQSIRLFVDLGMLSGEGVEDPAICFLELARLIVQAYAKERTGRGQAATDVADWIQTAWTRPDAPERRLRLLLEQRIFEAAPSRILLVVDRLDRVLGRPAGNPVARMFRQWMESREDRGWSKLRLILAATGSNLYFSSPDDVSEFLNITLRIRLESFALPDLRSLAHIYGRAWTDEEFEKLLVLVDGQPYLSRLILFLEATGTAKDELLDLERLKLDHTASQLQQMWLLTQDQEALRKPLCALLKNPKLQLSADDYNRLHAAGLVRKRDDRFIVPGTLLASYFSERC